MTALGFRLSASLVLLPFFRLSLTIKINFFFYMKNHILVVLYAASTLSRPQKFLKNIFNVASRAWH